MEAWTDYRDCLSDTLERLEVTDRGGSRIQPADAFALWVHQTREVHDAGRALYFVGNGGSAMIASHMAADASKNGGLRGMAFNDAALLTSVSNDISFEEIFALPLGQLGQAGDLLMTISSSGNSPNILRAIEVARAAAMKVVTLSGKGPDNRSRTMGDVNFYVPADRYGWVESAHHVVMHYWLDQYLNLHRDGAV
jgi:D-sedoheptulose 7-phosphate isomerase